MITNPVKAVHNLIIVDESASMQKLKRTVVESLNDTIKSIQKNHRMREGKYQRITLFTFNGLGIKMRRFNQWADQVKLLEYEEYKPNSTTPMLDCIGTSVGMIRAANDESERVLVTIISDGLENGSVKYCLKAIRGIITSMKDLGWIFNYVGAHHDVAEFCKTLNISNSYQINLNEIERMSIKDKLSVIVKQNSLYNENVMATAHCEAA